jgi:ribosomal protein S12 methylthiotransferase accessory factor
VRVTLHYFPMDHGVPTILAMMRSSIHQAPALVAGAATHLDPERAVQKSLEELAQTWTLSQWLKRTRRTFTPGKLWENVVDPKSHARLYCDHSKLKHSLFFFMEARSIDFESIPNRSMGEPAHDFCIVIQMLKQIGYQVLLADVTTEDVRELGLVVLRAVIPGFHPLFMGHRWRALGGERLWSVPQRLGYRGITQDKGDNSSPHPFA